MQPRDEGPWGIGRAVITDEVILRSLQGEAGVDEERDLREWRARATENEVRYRHVARLWDMRRLLEPALQEDRVPTAAEILRRGARRRSTPAVGAHSSRRPRFSRLHAAASLALVVGGGAVLAYLASRGDRTPQSLELVTAATEMTSARLADGTVVRLGPDSRLQVEVTVDSRSASLYGRAFFAVQHDPSRPFTVRTHAGEVVVRGTRFDVEARSGDLQLVVVDGAVELTAAGERVEVLAGQLSRVSDGGRPRVENVEDVYGHLDWVGDFVAFESTPLREVVRELERRYGLNIQIQDSLLAEQTVTSWSMERSPEEILAAVCLALDAFCTVTDSLATIER